MTHPTRDPALLRNAARRFERDSVRDLRQAAANWRDVGDETRSLACDLAADAVETLLRRGADAAGLPTGGGRA